METPVRILMENFVNDIIDYYKDNEYQLNHEDIADILDNLMYMLEDTLTGELI